ncbi:MAG: hypothetical protein ACM3S2_10335 [Ignavibacteriales bacterium]
MKTKTIIFLLVSFFLTCNISAQDGVKRVNKTSDDDNSKFTNIGNIGLTLTNFGMYGNGFSGRWPKQPSCEYPLGSGIEHIFAGGLWIGGYISKDASGTGKTGPFVTTGAVDKSSVSSRGGGFEYTNLPGSRISERSSLLTSKYFDPRAVSHQDFVMNFVDTNRVLVSSNNEPIPDHIPLGLAIHQETYAWNYTFANFFVIMNYWIKNVSDKYVDSVFVGLWTDTVIRNTIISPPGTSNFYTHGGNGYSDSLKIGYEFDSNGDVGFTDSYVGIQYLGASNSGNKANFVSWTHSNTTDPLFFTPMDDLQRYEKMLGYFSDGVKFNQGVNLSTLQAPSNRSILVTSGPFSHIAPGDSVNVVFAIVCAKKYGNDPASYDTKEQKKNLFTNAGWALRAYNGEDKNGNGVLDPGEDLDGDGKIKRFILPAPPASPVVKVVPEDRKVTIYWDKRAESSIDPISSKKDFEGYRLYRTNAGYDLTSTQDILGSMVLLAEFDSLSNTIGYNTGFSKVRLDEPVTFPGDTNKYYYKFEVANLLNGWQYTYSVTSFDQGDPGNNLESLESSVLASSKRIIPGTPPTSDKSVQIGVYPNPYYGSAYWDGPADRIERLRKIYFYNLPAKCEITIYTLAGDIVKRMSHDSNSNGSDLRWFETYAKDQTQIMSGGEHAWDIISDNDQAIASGLYLFTVKDSNTGEIKTGKFLIVK